MKPKMVIVMVWILTSKWTKCAATDNARFCSVRVCSESRRATHQIRVPIQLIHCNESLRDGYPLSGIQNRQINVTSTINCIVTGQDICSRVSSFPDGCLTITEMCSNPDHPDDPTPSASLCPPCLCNATEHSHTPDPPIISMECPTNSFTYPDVPTSSMPSSYTESDASSQTSKATKNVDSLRVAVMSLGVLVGILVALLAVVISGWLWTCWTVKKKNKATPEHVRTTQNTAYGVIRPSGNSTREEQTTGRQERQIETTNEVGGEDSGEYVVLEGPGGAVHLNQNKKQDRGEAKESGEEHLYHVLEGPGGEGYGDQGNKTGKGEVGGATDYEVPVSLKKD